mgnify:CR=1 FL=1
MAKLYGRNDGAIAFFEMLNKKESFNPIRKPDYFFAKLSVDEKNEIIKNGTTDYTFNQSYPSQDNKIGSGLAASASQEGRARCHGA